MQLDYVHLKTGNIYTYLHHAINCTNANNDQTMVIYCRKDKPEVLYVREEGEFFQKFKLLEQ